MNRSDLPSLLLLIVSLLSPWSVRADDTSLLAIGITGSENQASQFCDQVGHCKILDSVTEVVKDNGNSLVRLKQKVINQDVVLTLPSVMTPDQLMEALLKIRTLRTNAARKITVHSEVPLSEVRCISAGAEGKPIQLNMENLFEVAGAQLIMENGQSPRKIKPSAPIEVRQDFQRTYITGDQHPRLTKDLSLSLGIPLLGPSEEGHMTNAQVLVVSSAVMPVNENYFKNLSRMQQLYQAGARVEFVTGYLPYARSDKKDQDGVTVGGRMAADLIENAGAQSVTFVRPHAPQSEGFFKIPTFNVNARATLEAFLKREGAQMVVAPDAGSQKDDTLYADELGLPIAVVNKQRDPITRETKLVDISGPSVAGLTLVVIDDETATGGTLAKVAEFLKDRGAHRVIAAVTHLNGNAKKAIDSPHIDLMVVFDTIPANFESTDRLRILSSSKELAESLQELVHPSRRLAHCIFENISK